MRKLALFSAVTAMYVAGCATTGEQSSMSPEQLAECLQPNRRVMVELNGRTLKPAAKPPEAKPGEGKPPEAKPAEAKPAYAPVAMTIYVQGNTAFDAGSATLKPGGQQELDKMLADLAKRKVDVSAVIVSGHTDRLEAAAGNKALSEQRAKAVTDYLVSKGLSQKLIFWEGKEAREPVAVTKFCA
jgi:outer membrane protein OmpA-like peptidoglycan-associated protein